MGVQMCPVCDAVAPLGRHPLACPYHPGVTEAEDADCSEAEAIRRAVMNAAEGE